MNGRKNSPHWFDIVATFSVLALVILCDLLEVSINLPPAVSRVIADLVLLLLLVAAAIAVWYFIVGMVYLLAFIFRGGE